jgi:hypothetical protein
MAHPARFWGLVAAMAGILVDQAHKVLDAGPFRHRGEGARAADRVSSTW